MRNKRKAVSNKDAKALPAEGFHALDSVHSVVHQRIDSMADVVLGASDVGYTRPDVAAHDLRIRMFFLSDTHQPLTPTLQAPLETQQDFGVVSVSSAHFDGDDHVMSHVATFGNHVVHLPAQAITIDGSVSAFTVRCINYNNFLILMLLGSSSTPTQLPDNVTAYDGPMVLDFTSAEMVRGSAFPSCSSNVNAALPEMASPVRRRSRARGMRDTSNRLPRQNGAPLDYMRFGRCDKVCQDCNALFWLQEKRTGMPASAAPQYRRCCAGGRVVLRTYAEYPAYIVDLYSDRHFMDNIRAYNQMFAMTSFGATVDNSVNTGRGPYVFRVSGQIYHWIGGFCPSGDGNPRFLQMYVYDTDHEVRHRMSHFDSHERRILREDIIEGLIEFLNENNRLVHLFRTARDKLREADIPDFQIRLFGVVGSNQHELPTGDTIGAIVYDGGPESMTDYDVVIQRHS
ncbi:helitron helicase-like domain-containing protein [Artemisia annua]|uniref:Helitron helicase-like domain-containing protein n=1 Tax=Artemisia annua TaxID=35608 RepID=A0A2U1P7H4_ARTAN|nr:helitron helicase-like domain-containing protein [Artemisia annua]